MERLGSDRIQIQAGVRMGDLVAQVPGSRHRRESNDWTAPLSWAVCVAARGIFGAELQVGEALAAWSWERKAQIDFVLAVKAGQIPEAWFS